MTNQKTQASFDHAHAAVWFANAEKRFSRGQRLKQGLLDQRDEQRRQLLLALAKLPLLDTQRKNLPDAAEYLIEWSERAGNPRAIDGGREVAQEQIRALFESALSLASLVSSFHRDTLFALGGYDKRPEETLGELANVASDLYYRSLVGWRCLPSHTDAALANDQRKIQKLRARQMTVAATHIYEGLTGKPARISVKKYKMSSGEIAHRGGGHAIEFLDRIFTVFEITASAEAQLAALIKPRRNKSATASGKERRSRKTS